MEIAPAEGEEGAVDDAPDAPDKGERYVAVIDPYWSCLKGDIAAAVAKFNRLPGTRRPVVVEDIGRRLQVRGDGFGMDVTLEIEHECLRIRYMRHPGRRGETPRMLNLRLDMRPEHLVIGDGNGCPIDDPARFVLEPLFRALAPAGETGRRKW